MYKMYRQFSRKFLLYGNKMKFINPRIENCSTSTEKIGPLHGIKILDMTRVLAGPYATMILGDLGADIIKIEKTNVGDDTRSWGPPFVEGESCYFFSVNRNKRSVSINFKSPKGNSIIKELAAKCDVFIENFVPGNLKKSGLDYKSLSEIAPQLIYCSITGYGSTGPYHKRPGYDVIAASVGGLLSVTGPEDGEPCKVGVAMTDLATGLYAHGAVLAAILERNQTGLGQHIECNLLSTQIGCLVNLASGYLNGNQDTKRWGTAHASIVPYESFPTKDGYLTIGAGNDDQFKNLCVRLGLMSVCEDAKFASNSLRVQNRKELVNILRNRFCQKSTSEWLKDLEGCSFPYGPINSLPEVFSDPQVKHNECVTTVNHSVSGKINLISPAVKYSKSQNAIKSPPPILGEHTREVLKEVLNYDDLAINELHDEKVIQCSDLSK